MGRVGNVHEPPSAGVPGSQENLKKITEQTCRFSAVNYTKMRLAAGPLGSYSAPPDPLAVTRGKVETEGEGKGWE